MRGIRLRLLLVLLVLLGSTLVLLDARAGSGSPVDALRRGVATVLGPVQSALGGGVRTVGGALGGLPKLGGYRSQNQRLQAENDRLRAQLLATDGLRRTDAQLQSLLRTRAVADYPVVGARVVALGPSLGFAWTATLDAGSADGVAKGQTVLTATGLVGRVEAVGPSTCTALLLVDPGSTVGARASSSGGIGLATGAGSQGLTYELLDTGARIAPGDVLVTTQAGTYVPGVPVGRVTRVLTGRSALTRTAAVAPLVDVGTLDLVGIVVGAARTGTRRPLPAS